MREWKSTIVVTRIEDEKLGKEGKGQAEGGRRNTRWEKGKEEGNARENMVEEKRQEHEDRGCREGEKRGGGGY